MFHAMPAAFFAFTLCFLAGFFLGPFLGLAFVALGVAFPVAAQCGWAVGTFACVAFAWDGAGRP